MPEKKVELASPGRWAGIALAVLVLGGRLVTQSPSRLWRDWLVILSGYALYLLCRPQSPSRATVTLSVMAYLFGLYALGQIPHTAVSLGLSP
jgi:hypothetical protein